MLIIRTAKTNSLKEVCFKTLIKQNILQTNFGWFAILKTTLLKLVYLLTLFLRNYEQPLQNLAFF